MKVDEGCPECEAVGGECTETADCCQGTCEDGKCAVPCRPLGVNCRDSSECCRGACQKSGGSVVGTCEEA